MKTIKNGLVWWNEEEIVKRGIVIEDAKVNE